VGKGRKRVKDESSSVKGGKPTASPSFNLVDERCGKNFLSNAARLERYNMKETKRRREGFYPTGDKDS